MSVISGDRKVKERPIMSFWEMNRIQAGNDLVAGAAAVGQRMREKRAIRKQEEFSDRAFLTLSLIHI